MSTSSDRLEVQITAQDAGASTAFTGIINRVEALERRFGTLKSEASNAGQALESSFNKSGSGINIASEATSGFASNLRNLSSHANIASDALGKIGINGGAGVQALGGLSQTIESIGGAVPALLAVGAGIAAISAAFEFMKGAVDAAARWQSTMTVLGATIRAQGGDWNALKGSVEAWADVQERTTTFSRDEAVGALKTLVASGMTLADAQKSVRVAEDASAASGKSLQEVTMGLMQAEHGRTRILAQLGIGTRESMKAGMSYNQVLSQIEQHMSGAAAASAATYSGRVAQLGHAFETLQEKIGTGLLPILTQAVEGLINFVESLEQQFARAKDAGQQFYDKYKTLFDDLRAVIEVLGVAIRAALDVMVTQWKTAFDLIKGVVLVALDIIQGVIKTATDDIKGVFAVFGDILTGNWSKMWADLKATQRNVLNDLKSMLGSAWTDITNMLGSIWGNTLTMFGNFGSNMIAIAESVAQKIAAVLGGLAKAFGDATFGDPTKVVSDIGGGFQAAGRVAGPALKPWGFGGDAISSLGSGFTSHVATPNNPADTNTHVTARVGGPIGGGSGHKGSGGAAPYTPTMLSMPGSAPVDAISAQQSKMQDAIKGLAQSEVSYQNAIKLATTAQEKDAAETALRIKVDADRQAQIKLLVAAIAQEEQQSTTLTAQRDKDRASLAAAVAAYNDHERAMAGETKVTKAQQEEKKKLKAEVDALTKLVHADSKTLDENTAALTRNKSALQAQENKVSEVAAARAAALLQYNTQTQKSMQTMTDEIALYKASIADQIAYWQQRLALVKGDSAQELAQREQLEQKIRDLELQSYKQRQDAYDQFISTWQNREKTWLDGIIKGTTSLKDTLKNIWKTILDDFVQMIEQMILKSALLGQINSSIAGLFGMSAPGGGGGIGSILGSLTGGGGGGGGIGAGVGSLIGVPGGSATSALNVNIAGADSSAASAVGGGGGSLLAMNGGLGGAMLALGGAGMVGSAMGGLMHDSPGNHNAVIGSMLGVGALAGLVGGFSLGGIGAGLGALIASGPAGWALGLGAAILGGGIGGLFGDHTQPATSPDIYNTQAFGQAWANINGAGLNGVAAINANGQSFNEQAQVSQQLGGQGELAFISSWIAKNPTQAKTQLTQQQLQDFTGATTTTLLHDGNWTLNNGVTGNWADISNAANAAVTAILGPNGSAASTTPVFQLTRTYPDYNLANSTAPGAPGTGPTPPGTPGSPGNPGGSGGGIHVQPPGGGGVHIDFSGATIVGPGGMQEVIQKITQAMQQYDSGQIAGSYSNTLAGRGMRGDW